MQLTNYHFYNPKKHLYSKPVKGLQGYGLGYRFHFNGKERDNETYSEGNAYDFGARIHDPRLGRFISLDTRIKDFPDLSPFAFAANISIRYVDFDGQGPGDRVKAASSFFGKGLIYSPHSLASR